MSQFIRDNGLEGTGYCFHTASGYQCITRSHANNNIQDMDLEDTFFFTRRVVGADGYPYTEVGFSNVAHNEREELLMALKSCLSMGGFKEVDSIRDHHTTQDAFGEYIHPDPNTIAIRLNALFVNISRVVDIFGSLLPEPSKEFVKEQEAVPDVLYHSILSEMGAELEQSPGGKEYAIRKARELADTLERGFWQQ